MTTYRRSVAGRFSGLGTMSALIALLPGCASTMPSARIENKVTLPVLESTTEVPDPDRLSAESRGDNQVLTARSVIPLAFHNQPDIKSSFHRFKSEEARYDFFYVSRDAFTPRFRSTNNFDETRDPPDPVARNRGHTVEVGVEKRFFDTTRLDVGIGLRNNDNHDNIGNQPFVSASLRYPLGESREKLERTSEDIFRRNELDDAQLDYIEEVRDQLSRALFRFHGARDLERRLSYATRWQAELVALRGTLDAVVARDVSSDRRRLEAEITRVESVQRDLKGQFDVQIARLKSACGLAFHTSIELVDEPFNPFEGQSRDKLFRLSIRTDPEIATLQNAVKNAEVQLDLARRGKWDVSLLLFGSSDLEGGGERDEQSAWVVSAGLDVSAVDPRVTSSLARQAQANIHRFKQGIAARENEIYVDTLEPLLRIETLSASRDALAANLPRYVDDYEAGIQAYVAGTMNIDDLLKRRENLFDQEREIARLRRIIAANVTELCEATGKFFELLSTTPEPG